MKPVNPAVCKSVVLVLSLSIIPTLSIVSALAQAQAQTQKPESEQKSSSQNIRAIIDTAEISYKSGDEAFSAGDFDCAHKMFDQSLDLILQSGIDIRTNSTLEAYYADLVKRIHSHDGVSGETEKTAPSPLDQLSNLSEADLATVTTSGVRIYGKYDFDFSVADPVLEFVNYFVAGRGRSTMEQGLARSGRYRAMAERIFKEEHVPVDLIWLAQAESVWRPNALSRTAAKGIWQFVSSTGTRYGLAQTPWVDDRSQPEKSTRAAAQYLSWLHDHFAGDWLLAMAAYNAGENRVDEAISRCGYADFWELHKRGLLPQETRNYVPIILAIVIVSKNQKRYGFNVTPEPPVQFETVNVPTQTDLKVAAELCGVPYDVVQDLNPELRRGVTPASMPYALKVPKGLKKGFEEAYAKLPEDQRVRKVVVARDEERESYRPGFRIQLVAYHARSGDTLSSLSRRYGVPVPEIARANRLSSGGKLKKGQTIRIPMKARERGRHGYGRYKEEKAGHSKYASRGRHSEERGRRHHRRR